VGVQTVSPTLPPPDSSYAVPYEGGSANGVPATEAGSYFRLIHSCITQLKAQEPSSTCNESKEEEEGPYIPGKGGSANGVPA